MLLEVGATGRSPLHSFVQEIASLRSPRRERPSGRGLGAWRNDNRLYHRKNKRTDTFSAKEGGYVGHGTNIGCSSPTKTKNMSLLEDEPFLT
jgi:hypothetical protein